MMKFSVFFLSAAVFAVFSVPYISAQQAYTYTTESSDWTEDLSEKVDRSIKVLDVVRDELGKIKEDKSKRAVSGAPGQQSLADRMKGNISSFIRMFRRVSTMTSDGQPAASSGKEAEDMEQSLRDMKGKLDQTMEIISVIRQELEEIDKDKGQ